MINLYLCHFLLLTQTKSDKKQEKQNYTRVYTSGNILKAGNIMAKLEYFHQCKPNPLWMDEKVREKI